MQKVKNVTIRDIAQTCNVSIGTVSGVINDREHIRPEVRQKVLGAIKMLKYNPLKSKTGVQAAVRKSIGLVLPTDNTLDSFYSRAVIGLKTAVEQYNINFLLYTQDEVDRITSDEIYPGRQNLHCDGLIFFCPQKSGETAVRTAVEWGIRTVVIKGDMDISGVPVITDNQMERAELGLEHLYEKGHRRIGLLTWFQKGDPGFMNRYRAFLEKKGLQYNEDDVFPSAAEKGVRFRTWVDRRFGPGEDIPTAMMCDSDQAAVCLIQYLQDIGIKVPHQVAIAGINDDDLARLVMPGLTTVHVPVQEMLKKACDMMARSFEKGTDLRKKTVLIDNHLEIRGSTDTGIAEQPWTWMGYFGEKDKE